MKPINKPQSLGTILGRSSQLRELIAQARHNTDLLLQVKNLIPQALCTHCLAAHVRDQQLVLFTDSPAWVMRLRFCSNQILTGLQTTGLNVRGLRVRVQLPERQAVPKKRHHRLSADTRRHLAETADGIANPGLAAALKRLSGNG